MSDEFDVRGLRQADQRGDTGPGDAGRRRHGLALDALRLLVGEAAMTDLITVAESGVIVGALMFLAWSLSPVQRSRRRRRDARARIELRRALHEHAGAAGGRFLAAPAHDRPHGAQAVSR